MIKAVLFDLGGTLHVSSGSPERDLWFARRIIDRLAEYGIALEVSCEEFSRRLRLRAEEYKTESEKTLRELPSEIIWNDYYLKDYAIGRERLAPFAEELSFLYDYERVCNLRRPHLLETLDALRGMGLRLGVISNIISLSLVEHFLFEYGALSHMDCVITSAQTGIRKPSAEIFRIAEKRLGLGPECLAYVGDTFSRDVRGVRNANWRLMIRIHNPGSARRDVGMREMGYRADYEIRDLAEIPAILRAENGRETAEGENGV